MSSVVVVQLAITSLVYQTAHNHFFSFPFFFPNAPASSLQSAGNQAWTGGPRLPDPYSWMEYYDISMSHARSELLVFRTVVHEKCSVQHSLALGRSFWAGMLGLSISGEHIWLISFGLYRSPPYFRLRDELSIIFSPRTYVYVFIFLII